MDETQPQESKPISDDQELAKVLAGVSAESNDLSFEETPPAPQNYNDTNLTDNTAAPIVGYTPPVEGPVATEIATPMTPAPEIQNYNTDDLNSIKKDALTELRPLVDKLDLEPEEKFNIYLLLLRSTDDRTLIAPAHAAAKDIPDESKRAQALLDVIKEIDYLSNPTQTTV